MSENKVMNRSNVDRRNRKVDTLEPDENRFSFIVVIVDNFSKFVGLHPAKSKTS